VDQEKPDRLGRHSREEVQKILDELDRGEPRPPARDLRRFARHAYRDLVEVEVEQAGGSTVRYRVHTRNVSRRGIGFLAGQFIYPRCRCKVFLVDSNGVRQALTGQIVRCRYLPGTGSLHEVGVRLDQDLDVAILDRNVGKARPARLLLVGAEEPVRRFVSQTLAGLGIELTCEARGPAAAELAASNSFGLILIDVDTLGSEGLATVRELRQRGCTQPVVALAAVDSLALRGACLDVGCNGLCTKPLSREVLCSAVSELTRGPLTSSLVTHPELAELVDRFVAGLPDRVARLEHAYAAANYSLLLALARMLRSEGAAYGFNLISVAAAELERQLASAGNSPAARQALNELISWCWAARPIAATAEPVQEHQG